jgi:integrase
MTPFASALAAKIVDYVQLRRSLGYVFRVQAATLLSFEKFVRERGHHGPLTNELAVAFVLACDVTPPIRSRRHGVLRRFAEYLSVFDARTEALDPRALPRSRAIPPARILSDEELARLLAAARTDAGARSLPGFTLHALLGLLASTGLRSGEALRLDRADVDLERGLLQIRRTKFRKDRLVPLHITTSVQLRSYALERDCAFPRTQSSAFFLTSRGRRLSASTLSKAFRRARAHAGLDGARPRALRPHDLRHRFATTRLVTWYREGIDVQTQLPLLATYLGHVRYSDTAYYITGTAELLGLAAERVFARKRSAR